MSIIHNFYTIYLLAISPEAWHQSVEKKSHHGNTRGRQRVEARIPTGFHGVTEIGQSFRNKHIFNIELSKLKSGKWSGQMFSISNFQALDTPSVNQKTGEGNLRELKSKKIPGGASGGACPRAPLEACSLGPSFRKSVSIYPRSKPDDCSFLSAHPGGNFEGLLRFSAFPPHPHPPSSIFLWHNSEVANFWIVSPREVWTFWGLLLDIIFYVTWQTPALLCYELRRKNSICFISPTFIIASVVFRREQQVGRCCNICWIWGSSVEETSRKNLKWHALD